MQTIVRETSQPEITSPEQVEHYVPKHLLTEALVNGTPVLALCGQTWVPSGEQMKYPLCGACESAFQSLAP